MANRIFKSANEFSIYIENEKARRNHDTYLETIMEFYESETDLEPNQIAKLINRQLKGLIEDEARQMHLIKNDDKSVSLTSFLGV